MDKSAIFKHFFISYTKADSSWAEWITWQLEQAGYSTIFQAWDFRPGSNFVHEMDTASKTAERTIAILSPDYLVSRFTQAEWGAAFQQDPTGERGLLVPVRVRPCNMEGVLRQIVYIDLVGLNNEASAREALLNGVRRGRAKPSYPPAFPVVPQSITKRPAFPGTFQTAQNGTPFSDRPNFTAPEQDANFSPSNSENITTAPRKSRIGKRIMMGVALCFIIGVSVICLAQAPRNNGGKPSQTGTNDLTTSVVNYVATVGAYTRSYYTAVRATAIAEKVNPYQPGTGSLVLEDPLSKSLNWHASANKIGACQFVSGKYYINTSQPKKPFTCIVPNEDFSNIAFEVQMTFAKGDCGGLIFRASSIAGQFYGFKVCQDGSYDLSLYSDGTDANAKVLKDSLSQEIHTEANQSNIIAIVANDNNIALYINAVPVDSVSSDMYSHGEIGLFAEELTGATEVAFSTARVWRL